MLTAAPPPPPPPDSDHACVRVCVCARVCVYVCVRASVCVCVYARVTVCSACCAERALAKFNAATDKVAIEAKGDVLVSELWNKISN